VPYKVGVTDNLRRDLAKKYRWWRRNRTKAPRALQEEMAQLRKQLAQHPASGVEDDEDEGGSIRVIFLERTSYWLSYQVDHRARTVLLVDLTHTSRLRSER